MAIYSSHKEWRDANKKRIQEYSRKRGKRARKPCKRCNKPIPFPSPGRQYCDKNCQKQVTLETAKKQRIKWFKKFGEFKTNLGCSKCGYNKCAAALDFHHVGKRNFRITAMQWKTGNSRTKQELASCILLCSNCHHEVHEDVKRSVNGDGFK